MSSMSSILQFGDNPRRGYFVLGAILLVMLAVFVIAVRAIPHSGGCTAVLDAQRYGCLAALAGSTGNVAYCNQIGSSGMRNSCLLSVAESTRNISACGAFPEGQYRTNCIENISYSALNPSMCGGLSIQNQSECSYNIALRLNFSRASVCNEIENSTDQNLCTSQSYYHLALATGNYSYCGSLSNQSDGELIYAMSAQNPNYQSNAYGYYATFAAVSPRDFCYSSIPSTPGHNSCSYIANSSLRTVCSQSNVTGNYSLSIQNESAACGTTSNSTIRNLCYFGLYTNQAVRTLNESWCGLIPNQSYTETCIVNLANETGNVTYCGDIRNTNDRQSCIYETQASGGNYT